MYNSYRDEVNSEMDRVKVKALTAVGILLLGKMKMLVPVDTGRLKSSLQYDVETADEGLYVGSGEVDGQPVYYATFAENNRPFVKPSVFNNVSAIKRLVNQIFAEEF